MARSRVGQSIRFEPALYQRIKDAASERGVSVNWLVEKLLAESLDRLIPVNEFSITRKPMADRERQGIPDLEFLTPDCPVCGLATEFDDGWFECSGCNIVWRLREGRAEAVEADQLKRTLNPLEQATTATTPASSGQIGPNDA